ncbi:hypothetical protein AYI69_g11162, partial [Smittium culicis]
VLVGSLVLECELPSGPCPSPPPLRVPVHVHARVLVLVPDIVPLCDSVSIPVRVLVINLVRVPVLVPLCDSVSIPVRVPVIVLVIDLVPVRVLDLVRVSNQLLFALHFPIHIDVIFEMCVSLLFVRVDVRLPPRVLSLPQPPSSLLPPLACGGAISSS